jgi:K+-transporting ATPase ATPase C chain
VGSSARAALLVMLIAGVAYPLLTTGVAQILFPHAANGSLIERDGQRIGSALIGQQFASDAYFQGRPSATLGADPAQPGASVPAPYNAGASGASNQGGTHQGLAEVVAQRVDQYRAVNGLAAQVAVPVDAVTASASGLDPHISLANAQLQVARVAKARGLLPDQVPPEGMGQWAPFFGKPAYTMTLAARLAQQTGAQIVLIWGERLAWGHGFDLHASGLDRPLSASLDEAVLQINQAMEALVQSCPSQYLWGYARYKAPRRDL